MDLWDPVNLTISLVALSAASFYDLKAREVPDEVWAFLFPYSLCAFCFRFLAPLDGLALFSSVIGIALALLFSYLGMFGGADAKAFICLSLLFPKAPDFALFPPATFAFPVTLMLNSALLVLSVVPYCALRNAVKWAKGQELYREAMSPWRKAFLFLTACKVPLRRLLSRGDFFPLQRVDDGRLSWVFRVDIGEDPSVQAQKLKEFFGTDDIEVWATPAIPMMVFITAGLIVSFFFGDFLLAPIFLSLSS